MVILVLCLGREEKEEINRTSGKARCYVLFLNCIWYTKWLSCIGPAYYFNFLLSQSAAI